MIPYERPMLIYYSLVMAFLVVFPAGARTIASLDIYYIMIFVYSIVVDKVLSVGEMSIGNMYFVSIEHHPNPVYTLTNNDELSYVALSNYIHQI
jgi:hypothetical protein